MGTLQQWRARLSRYVGTAWHRTCLGALLMMALLVGAPLARAADMVPYLQTPAATSMWVSWKTSAAGTPVVEYGSAPNALTQTKSGTSQKLAANYFFHGVQLTGLEPDTAYWYRIRTNSAVSAVKRFRTQPASSTTTGKYRILVVGDHQIIDQDRHKLLLERARATIEAQYGKPLEDVVNILINDGDQVDVGTLDHWENLHMRQSAPVSGNIPIMTTLGNHEVYYDDGLVNWKAHFFRENLFYKTFGPGPDERYYANHVGRVLFLHLDGESPSDSQKTWVQNVVNAAATDTSVDWIISVIHRPYQAEQYVGDISTWLRTQVMPILSSTRKHVLNIAGHHHLYARGQTRDYPTYHMISGGTAWDQYWGQSTEQDFDDVQKTIANWTWQLIEIDIQTKEMTVRSYSEAHPKLGFTYNSRLTDEFHRKLNHGAPEKPAFANNVSGTQPLPLRLTSTQFQSMYGEVLNSTQFQVARDPSFASIVLDKLRDVENLYGDTGAPLYEPVDLHAGVDILSFEIAAMGLPNGSYWARTRHRDANVEWSPWSDTVNFTVTGSTTGSPALTLAKKVYAASGDPVVVTYANSTGNPKDWIGIYKKGQSPGGASSTKWGYVSGLNGQLSFTGLTTGTEYYAAFFTNDGYTELAPRVPFYVGPRPTVTLGKSAHAVGENVVVTWSGALGGASSTDWIGLYRVGQEPGGPGSTQWTYVRSPSGSYTFSNLPKGYYYATFLVNGGYFEVIQRVAFSVGERIATLTIDDDKLDPGQEFAFTFSDGPGIAKDYIGIFKTGATPGVDKLVAYYYVGGKAAGTVRVADTLPDGSYFAEIYTNDSYTAVSNRVQFAIGDVTTPPTPPQLGLDKGQYLDSDTVKASWSNVPTGSGVRLTVFAANGPAPLQQQPLSTAQGTLSLGGFAPGSYYVTLLSASGTELTARIVFRVVKLGDINGDGRVNETDRDLLRAAIGSCAGQARYLPAANFDTDVCITQQDYKLWYAIWKAQ